ncbi:MAG: hypothetical protein IK004_07165 [Bacteroidales bacterium]|nr:hypothetical protein [Bacteroidales bacterium]
MAYDINAALERLEQNLKNLNSAREQVESVVESHSNLQDKVQSFVNEVANLSKQVESFMHALEEKGANNLADFKLSLESLNKSCTEIISSFENKTTMAVNSVKSEVDNLHGEIEKLSKTQNDLASATDAINKLNTDVEGLTKELIDSQSAQDDLLKIIYEQLTSLTTLSSDIDRKANSIQQYIQNQSDSLDKITLSFDELSSKIDNNKESLDSALIVLSDSVKSNGENSEKNAETLIKENRMLKIVTVVNTILIISAIIVGVLK